MKKSLEKKDFQISQYKKTLVNILQGKPQGATLKELILATGLNSDWIEYTLRQLINEYPAQLTLNDEQELQYRFDFKPKSKTLLHKLKKGGRALLDGLWKGFMYVFKVWILLMLFTYGLFNVAVLTLTLAAVTRSGTILEGALRIFARGFREGKRLFFDRDTDKPGPIQQVFSYVFGPSSKKKEERVLERRILAAIRQNQGRLYVAELIKLTGWSADKAREEAAYLMANYQGDASVDKQGHIVYRFPDWETDAKRSKNNLASSQKNAIWQHLIPRLRMNDNDRKTNRAIASMNAFNMLMAVISPLLLKFFFYQDEVLSGWMLFLTLFFPLVFSMLFFLVPLLRKPLVHVRNRRIEAQNKEYQALGAISEKAYESIQAEELALEISRRFSKSQPEALDLIRLIAREQEAEVLVSEEGRMVYLFKNLQSPQPKELSE